MASYTMEQIKEWARSKGGKCLSDRYKYKEKLIFCCAKGHEWTAEAYAVKRGRWCPYCFGSRGLGIEQMREIAASRGGKCLSKTYVNCDTKLTWQCAEGHVWESSPTKIKHEGHWCPECGKNMPRLSLIAAKKAAREKGGKCLAERYKGRYKDMKWQCKEGHTFSMPAIHVLAGEWCPLCG
jgi:hypothetical protein